MVQSSGLIDERRSTQRVRLFTPVSAHTAEGSVLLLDLSASGARIEHLFALRVGSELTLTLDYGTAHLDIDASVIRCRIQQRSKRPSYTSAIRFATEDETLIEGVRALIRTIVHDDLPARVTYA